MLQIGKRPCPRAGTEGHYPATGFHHDVDAGGGMPEIDLRIDAPMSDGLDGFGA
jgi:hypothetical protein